MNGVEDRVLGLPDTDIGETHFVLASTLPARLKGLLFTPPGNGVLVLVPCKDIHTFGMEFALDVAFVDAEGRVLESCRDVLPRSRLRNRHAVAVLERFAVPKRRWFVAGDRLELGLFARDERM